MPRKKVKRGNARHSTGRRAQETVGNLIPKSLKHPATIVGGVGWLTARGGAPQYLWFGLMLLPIVIMALGYRIEYRNGEDRFTFERDDLDAD